MQCARVAVYVRAAVAPAYDLRLRDLLSVVVFFQAEDGIRDLVRSRGLGDVYKRQRPETFLGNGVALTRLLPKDLTWELYARVLNAEDAVSYTHLTLPTSDLV